MYIVWLLVVAGGPLLLGAVMVYGQYKKRALSPEEARNRTAAIDELYQRAPQHEGPAADRLPVSSKVSNLASSQNGTTVKIEETSPNAVTSNSNDVTKKQPIKRSGDRA